MSSDIEGGVQARRSDRFRQYGQDQQKRDAISTFHEGAVELRCGIRDLMLKKRRRFPAQHTMEQQSTSTEIITTLSTLTTLNEVEIVQALERIHSIIKNGSESLYKQALKGNIISQSLEILNSTSPIVAKV